MKLLSAVVATVLAMGGAARADDLYGPVDPYAAPPPAPTQRVQRGEMPALRQLLIARFDRNHDGRLEPRERRQAIRALRRLERKLAREDNLGRRRMRAIVRRYDLNGDGNVGPGEMPPAMANRLRLLDRNGDGWLDEGELGPRR